MSAAAKLQDRAAKALDMLTTRSREENTFATGRANADHHLGPHMGIDAVTKGVTVGWLAQAMDMNHDQVKKKLANCPPLRKYKNGFVYDFKIAVAYLIKPKFDIDSYIKQARIEDLPLRLQTEFWQAKNRRREYEEQAGRLWRSEQVFEVLGEVFQTIKYSTQLWSANLERTVGLSDVQRKLLQGMIDNLQSDLHAKLVGLAANKKTKSLLAEELEDEAREEAERAAAEAAHDQEEEFDVAEYV